ncbi:MAG: sulfite exporter TauE/SafE family protein [Desulfovibrionaceae bacterium]|nr:sulfite exporter TauE/SafE family protein [Desulfovibrionaceae bacterium]
MYFPVANIECNPFIPPLAAFIVSFFTSMGGISGAFLLLPFQMSFLGYVNPSVSATNQFFNVVAIPSGVWRFAREGRMVWPLAAVVAMGTMPGVFFGALIRVNFLPDPTTFKLFVACVLLYIGGRMLRDMLRQRRPSPAPLYSSTVNSAGHTIFSLKTAQAKPKASNAFPQVRLVRRNWQEIVYSFDGEEYGFSTRGVFVLTFIVGIIGGVYGIGGGAIISPFLVSFFALPIHTVAGAALLATFLTSSTAVIFYMLIAPLYPAMSISPDFALGLLLGVGGMAGMYCGARLQKYVPARFIKTLLLLVLLGTAWRYGSASLLALLR